MPKCYWSLATLYKMEGLFSICNTQLLIKTSIVIKKNKLYKCCNYLLLSRIFLCVNVMYLMFHCMCLIVVNKIFKN